MYKAIASFWSKPSTNKTRPSSEPILDEDSWVFVSNTGKSFPCHILNENIFIRIDTPVMNSSWIATPPLVKTDQSSEQIHHFNPIENLLIEHASKNEMIYERCRSTREYICRYECL